MQGILQAPPSPTHPFMIVADRDHNLLRHPGSPTRVQT
jgi:hypothetical protein